MRLKRLDLARYGKFTGHVLNFGERQAGEPDLHIVYGPNEAGKSTAFSAFLDLLFGIESRSRYNFLHPYPTMRIGASLETESGLHDIVRIKRPQNSLLDGNDGPISEGLIQAELGGLDRDAYRMMFSLDDETLEAGGESILASKGDLGQLLFSASAGLADLSRALTDLRTEADGFYKYRARSGELAALKAELTALKAERDRIDTFAAEYAQLIATRDRSSAQYHEAFSERLQIQTRMDEIQRHLSALPRLAALKAIRERLAPLAPLPDAPPGWTDDMPKLQAEDIELATRAKGLASEIEQISDELDAIVVDEQALALGGRIEHLAELRARFVTAEKDLPDRRLQLRDAELAVSGILGRLGRANEPDPARLVLGASTVGALRALIEARSGVETAAQAARTEHAAATQRLEEACAALGDAGGGPAGAGRKREAQLAALAGVVAALRGGDLVPRKRMAEKACAAHRNALEERIAALRPWAGDADALAELTVPGAAELERWSDALAEAQKHIERYREDNESLEAKLEGLRAEAERIGTVPGVIGDRDAALIRTAREEAWASHRVKLNAASADAFEAALRHDDIVTNARLRHEKEITALEHARNGLTAAEADLGRRKDRLQAALAARQSIGNEIADALNTMALPSPDATLPGQLQAWLNRRDKALEVRANLNQAQRDLREAEADLTEACCTLSSALEALDVPHDAKAGLDALLATAQAAIDHDNELKTLRTAIKDCERDLKSRERTLEKTQSSDTAWQSAWAGACSACWLGDGGVTPSTAAVREILAALGELGSAIKARAGLADRIVKMQNDAVSFENEAAALARELGLDAKGVKPLDLAHRITDRAQAARTAQSLKTARLEALEAARGRQRGIAEALAVHAKRKVEMTAFFGVASLAEVAMKLQDIGKRADLQAHAGDAERDIVEALRAPSIDEAETTLANADRTAFEAELSALKARFDDQDLRVRDLFSASVQAADRVDAVGGDDAAARIEEKRRTALLDIEDKALRYIRLRLGIVAAEQALRAYRDKHRSQMMARASAAFRTISRNAYTSLTTQLEKDSEFLIAVAADGGSKVASDLSKGTRFQLYLALRVAGYYEFAQSRRPVPFIADDIMETFDDFRAEEAFRLFSEMAEVGQVIYLTHHKHLCDIARRIAPHVQVHDLAA
jgi:uncharacterized protein YhaN